MEASPTRRLHLWEVADELAELAEVFVENGGILTEELEQKLDALNGSFFEKVERIALFAQECKANGAGTAVELERLTAMKRAYENRERGLKMFLQTAMERAGRKKVETPRVRVRVQKNGGLAPLQYSGDPATLPEDLRRVLIEPAYSVVRERADAGKPLPEGFRFEERGKHVEIY